jgi:hypothetical protein
VSLLAAPFRTASRWRGARVFHPYGAVWHAEWRPSGTDVLPGSRLVARTHPALLRLSHAIGAPPHAPDVLGWAVSVLDVHGPGRDQDLLLASTGDGRVTRHLLRPARRLTGTTMSSLLPYDVAGHGRRVVTARAVPSRDVRYADVLAARAPVPAFSVRLGGPDGPEVATVHATGRAAPGIAAALRYDPWHTGPELRPVGWPNRLRRPTYRASQDGRGAPAAGWRATAWRPPVGTDDAGRDTS